MDLPGIALLGPLSVNGDAVVLSPRDRVVLAVLAIRPGDVVSAERLADALWGEHPPASWNKVVPGCILRLRRALGAEAIETTPFGYRLALAADQVDVQRFERLLERGRELLTLGEPERAQHTLDEALDLWRGLPLMDLDGWEPARIEAARLTELRLSTEEFQLDAALRAGRHSEVLARAQTAVAQAPLRERRWGLLALAQYRAGRQGEALRTLHRARTVLVNELGLDPGPELAALEGAILRQDPALTVPAALPDAAAICPYLGLFCYDIVDAEKFFGRDIEIADCMRRLQSVRLLAVVGPSGSGKSSLVRAGIAAALERAGRRPFVVTAGSRPTSVLTDSPSVDTVLIVDQFEEVFTLCTAQEREQFFAGLVAEAAGCPVVISMRADHLAVLAAYPDIARLIERGLYLLGPMGEDGLRAAITRPADSAGMLMEPGLVDLLIREVEGQPGALPLLSHALRRTWERREGRTLTVDGYRATGGIRGSVAQSAEQLYESLTPDERLVLRKVLLRLVSAADEGDPVRTRVPRRLLLTDPERERIVNRLVAARLVTANQETVEIAHESLVRAWPRLSNWLEDDAEGLRILRHLTASADAWQGMGEPDSELYRGARLTTTLDWRSTAHPDLTVTEAAFLDQSAAARDAERAAATKHHRNQARARRRTRLLVTGVAALLVAVLVASLLVVRQQAQREAADLAATVAEARRVDDAARSTTDVDRALLLAIQAHGLYDSAETRAVLADLLSARPALIRSLAMPTPVHALAVSPDGATLLVGSGDSGTASYGTTTLSQTAAYPAVPGWTMDFRPDGQQLLLVGRGYQGMGDNDALSAALADPAISIMQRLHIDGLRNTMAWAVDAHYSADGRFVVVGGIGYDDSAFGSDNLIDSAVAVWDVATPDRPALVRQPLLAFAVSLSPDGRLLYVATRDPALTVIDVATGQLVNSIPLSATTSLLPPTADVDDSFQSIWDALSDGMEVSPDGKTVAVAQGNDVLVYDAATLTERARLRGHTDLIRSLQFSHNGSLLVSGSADHTAVVWELATGRVVLRTNGHADAVLALAFSPDDGTLYTGGLDKHVLVWDLTGSRRFVARVVDGTPRVILGKVAAPSPDGRAVVYVGPASRGDKVRFLDIPTGQLGEPVIDRNGDALVAWLGPDNERVVTVADRSLRVWSRGTGQLIKEIVAGPSKITAIAATPDGRYLVVGNQDGELQRIDANTLSSAGPRIRFDSKIAAVAAGNADTAVALLDDKSYVIVDLATGTEVGRGDLTVKPAVAAVSADGARLAIGGSAGEVGLLDLGSQEWVTAPQVSHRQSVGGVAFSTDGRTLVTSSFDAGVRLWNGSTGESIAGVQVGQDPSAAVATVSPDGTNAIVATRDGAVYRVDSRFEEWTDFACAVAARNFTPDEWLTFFGDQPYRETCPAD